MALRSFINASRGAHPNEPIARGPSLITQSTSRPPETVEQLASAISELMAHLYVNTWSELSKLPADPAGEHLLDKLYGAVADLDEIANKSHGQMVRRLLDGAPQGGLH